LNLLPFMLLVLLYTVLVTGRAKLPHYLNKVGVVFLAAIIGWLPLFNWTGWSNTLHTGTLLSFNYKSLRNFINFANPVNKNTNNSDANFSLQITSSYGLPKDAWLAVDYLQKHFGEPFTILNGFANLTGVSPPPVWNAFHSPANYWFMPAHYKHYFLSATATSLHHAGWLIVDKNYPASELLAIFDSVYRRTNQLEFGTYYAIRFSPKNAATLG
jgi:hypothetical protein